MFEKLIENTKARILNSIETDNKFIYLQDLLHNDGIDPCFKSYFTAEVAWWVYKEQLIRGKNKHFDLERDDIKTFYKNIDELYMKSARFDRNNISKVTDNAVKTVLNYLVRPQTTLKWFIFRGELTKSFYEIILRLDYFYDYSYLKNAIILNFGGALGKLEQTIMVTSPSFAEQIDKIDSEKIATLDPDGFIELIKPIFELFNHNADINEDSQIPIEAIILYFDDKSLALLKQKTESMLFDNDIKLISVKELRDLIESSSADISNEMDIEAEDFEDNMDIPDFIMPKHDFLNNKEIKDQENRAEEGTVESKSLDKPESHPEEIITEEDSSTIDDTEAEEIEDQLSSEEEDYDDELMGSELSQETEDEIEDQLSAEEEDYDDELMGSELSQETEDETLTDEESVADDFSEAEFIDPSDIGDIEEFTEDENTIENLQSEGIESINEVEDSADTEVENSEDTKEEESEEVLQDVDEDVSAKEEEIELQEESFNLSEMDEEELSDLINAEPGYDDDISIDEDTDNSITEDFEETEPEQDDHDNSHEEVSDRSKTDTTKKMPEDYVDQVFGSVFELLGSDEFELSESKNVDKDKINDILNKSLDLLRKELENSADQENKSANSNDEDDNGNSEIDEIDVMKQSLDLENDDEKPLNLAEAIAKKFVEESKKDPSLESIIGSEDDTEDLKDFINKDFEDDDDK